MQQWGIEYFAPLAKGVYNKNLRMGKAVGIGILSIIFALMFSLALAQEASPLAPSAKPTPINYTLPYPGILPDHPLYFLKSLRDLILTKLISNPVKKFEFDLLQADKKLNMAIFLKMKSNLPLMHRMNRETVGHLKEADTHLFAIAAAENNDVRSLKDRYELSLKKHLQELTNLKEGLGVEDQAKIDEIISQTDIILNNFYSKR